MMPRLFALFLLTGCALADQNDPRLNDLFEQLRSSPDPEASHHIESMIWAVWLSHDDPAIEQLLQQGISAMNQGDYPAAVELFSEITSRDANFAEGWNKRATVYYLQNDLTASMHDVQRTLALEPRHFGALAGLGLIFTTTGDLPAAIRAYQDVLRIHPQSIGARVNIEQLQQTLRKNII